MGTLSGKVLLYATVRLRALARGWSDIYVHTQIPALLAEQPFNGYIVGAAHAQESCEALLSWFARHGHCTHRPQPLSMFRGDST